MYLLNRRMLSFSPISAVLADRCWATVTSSFMMNFCSSRQTSSKILFILPSTIFSTTLAGLPVARAWDMAISFSFSRKDWVTSSLVTNWGAGSWAATCMAISLTSRWKFSVRATKSVSQFTSTSTPTRPPGWM